MTELERALIRWAMRRSDEIADAAGGHSIRTTQAATIVGIEAGIRMALTWPSSARTVLDAIETGAVFGHVEITQARDELAPLVKAAG